MIYFFMIDDVKKPIEKTLLDCVKDKLINCIIRIFLQKVVVKWQREMAQKIEGERKNLKLKHPQKIVAQVRTESVAGVGFLIM